MTAERVLRWVAAAVIAAIACLRVCATFVPRLVFDVDPVLDHLPIGGFGPAGSLTLDALLLAACAAGLYGESLAGRAIDWRLAALALIPVPVVAWHGAGDFGDLWRGATWIAAVAGAVAVAHLARDRAVRPLLIAVLAAVLVPVLVRGLSQSAVSIGPVELAGPERAATIREFELHRSEFFADRGWTEDSPAARIYERRLRTPDPRGWFPTSNIFASLMAFGAVTCLGLAVEGALRRRGRSWIAGFGAAAAVAAAGLVLAGSKGALGAALIGAAIVGAAGWLAAHPERRPSPRVAGAAALGLVGCVLLAVVVRGVLLPEGFLGDRSLLFRWHYLSGAARVVEAHRLHGVGPDGFQAAYVAVRSPRSPEEVTSAHGMIADWLATLGVFGLAWVGVAGTCLWRAGAALVEPPATGRTPAAAPNHARERGPLVAAAAVALLGLLPALAVEYGRLGDLTIEALRLAGLLGFVTAAAVLGALLSARPPGFADRALAAGAIVLVAHGQIEMTFFDPGSCVWALAIVGAAGVAPRDSRGRRWPGVAGAVGFALAAAWLAAVWIPPAFAAQRWAIGAAEMIGTAPTAPGARAEARIEAVELLEAAWERLPSDGRLLHDAVGQLLMVPPGVPDDGGLDHLERAAALADRAVELDGSPHAVALAADAWDALATRTGRREDRDRAIAFARRLTELDPHGIGVWVRCGDALWSAGRRDEAAEAYRRALDASANFELDPLKQLGERERDRLEERLRGDSARRDGGAL